MAPNSIENKVIVITGASSGLGEATARRLAAHGAKLVLGARRIERLKALSAELGLGADAAVQTDVTHCEQVQRLVDAAAKTHGRIDVLLNNAGLMPHSPLERLKITDWDRMIDVNLKGVLYGIAAALPHMKAQKAALRWCDSSARRRQPARRRRDARPPSRDRHPRQHAFSVLGPEQRADRRPHVRVSEEQRTGRSAVGSLRCHDLVLVLTSIMSVSIDTAPRVSTQPTLRSNVPS